MSISKFIKSITKCFKRDAGVVADNLPAARAVNVELMPLRVACHLPTTLKPIPELDVSVSTSTSLAMFEHMSVTSMKSTINSFTTHDTFEDVDLASPTMFANPPKGRKTKASPFDDEHEVDSALTITGHLNNDEELSHTSSVCSTAPLVPTKQSRPATPPGTPTSLDDEHTDVSETAVEYVPTTAPSGNEYTERAMEYQRVSILFGSGSPEYNNIQRDHTLGVLEGTKPQSTQPLNPELMDTLAVMMGKKRRHHD